MSASVSCRVCGAATEAFMCFGCGQEIAYALAEIPGLIRDVIDRERRATKVYRQARWRLPEDEELAGLEEEYGWRWRRIKPWLRDRDGRITLPATGTVTDMDAATLADEARNTLTTTVRDLCESRGIDGPTDPIPAIVVDDVYVSVVRNRWRIVRERRIVAGGREQPLSAVCAWLMLNLDTIRYDEAAAEIHGDLIGLRAKLARAVDSSPAWVFAGPCECGVDLYRPHGADKIECNGRVTRDEGCGREYTAAERTDWLLGSIADALVPLGELRDFLKSLKIPWPPATTVASWRSRGQLVSRGPDMHGNDLFVGADVLEQLDEWRMREATRRARAC